MRRRVALHPSPYHAPNTTVSSGESEGEEESAILQDANGTNFAVPRRLLCHTMPVIRSGWNNMEISFPTDDAPNSAHWVAIGTSDDRAILAHGFIMAQGSRTTCYLLYEAGKEPGRIRVALVRIDQRRSP